MDRTWPTGCLKSFRTIATHTKFPISLLILHGKTLHDPNSTFNKIDAYQIRNSIADGLPEMALLQRDVMMQSQQKNILQQVDDCFHMFKVGGLNAFIILFPACCGLTNDDAQLLLQIYSNDRLALIDQTFILISGTKQCYEKHHREFKTEVINCLADIGAIRGTDCWAFAKYRFAHLESVELTQMLQMITNSINAYESLKPKEMSIGLPPTIVINEKEQMMQVQQRVTSFTYLLEFEDYFKYCASRTSGVAMVMNQLYEHVFADPSYAPMLAMATNFVQFLSEIKMRMPNAVEYNVVTHIEVKHYRRFWKRRSAVLSTDVLGNSHFLRIQIERIQGLPSAFDIAFDAIPFVRFAGNISIYRSKQELIDIGNCIEIGEPEPAQDPISAFQQQMDSASVPNRHRPWYMLVDESNIEAYEAVLKYIINKAYLGSKLKIDKFR